MCRSVHLRVVHCFFHLLPSHIVNPFGKAMETYQPKKSGSEVEGEKSNESECVCPPGATERAPGRAYVSKWAARVLVLAIRRKLLNFPFTIGANKKRRGKS